MGVVTAIISEKKRHRQPGVGPELAGPCVVAFLTRLPDRISGPHIGAEGSRSLTSGS